MCRVLIYVLIMSEILKKKVTRQKKQQVPGNARLARTMPGLQIVAGLKFRFVPLCVVKAALPASLVLRIQDDCTTFRMVTSHGNPPKIKRGKGKDPHTL